MSKRLCHICQICSKGFEFKCLLIRHQTSINSKCVILEKLKDGECEPDFYYSDTSSEDAIQDAIFDKKKIISSNQEVNEKKIKNIKTTKQKVNEQKVNEQKLSCPKCGSIFKHYKSKYRHIKNNSCNFKTINIENISVVSEDLPDKQEIHEEIKDVHLPTLDSVQIDLYKRIEYITTKLDLIVNILESKNIKVDSPKVTKKSSPTFADLISLPELPYIINPTTTTTTIDNTDNSNIAVTNSGTIYNDNSKNTNITNVIQYINPIGLEDISFLKLKDIMTIFSKGNDISHIISTLTELIYSIPSNINFLKQNLNKATIKYLNDKHEVKAIHESKFKESFRRVIVDSLIKLIHKYKNHLHIDSLDSYVNIAENLDNIILSLEIEKKKSKQDESILNQVVNTTIDQVLRTEDKAFYEYVYLINKNPDIKKRNYKASQRTKCESTQIINEFKYPPKDPLAIEDSTNLFVAKERAKTKIQQKISDSLAKVYDRIVTSEDIARRENYTFTQNDD